MILVGTEVVKLLPVAIFVVSTCSGDVLLVLSAG